MNTITLGWKKQKFREAEVASKNKVSQNHPASKNPPTKQKNQHGPKQAAQYDKTIEQHAYEPLATRNLVFQPSSISGDDIQMYDDNRFCSSRAGITTFIIVAVIIIVAGASVGIVFAVIKSSSSSGTGTNNKTNSFTTITSGLYTSSVSIGSQSGPPCSSYTTINDPTRSATYVGSNACDNGPLFNGSNGGAWIRFIGTGGTTIPTTSIGTNHCGAYLAGWYNNTLPLTTNTISNGTVCFDTGVPSSTFVVYVSVILCPGTPNNYYVYFLPPTNACSARYCTN